MNQGTRQSIGVFLYATGSAIGNDLAEVASKWQNSSLAA